MARKLSRPAYGRANGDPKDSLGVLLNNQIQVAVCPVTPRVRLENSHSIFLRVAVSPVWAPNSKIDRRGYGLSMNPEALKYPPAIQSWDVASSQG